MKKQRRETSQNRWTRDTDKESYWKAQLDLWQRSGLSVRAFCKERGIVETSFYAWRRELIIRARESGEAGVTDAPVAATPNTVKDGRGRTVRTCFRETNQGPLQSRAKEAGVENPFVSLSLVSSTQAVSAAKRIDSATLGLQVNTPAGYSVAIASANDLDLFRQVLTILEGVAKC